MAELLDKDKPVVIENDLYPALNDCRLGRYILRKVHFYNTFDCDISNKW